MLPDSAWVVRGGTNTPDRFEAGAEGIDDAGRVVGVSVRSAAGVTVRRLAESILHKRIGVTTVGRVREAGGDVVASPLRDDPYHALLTGLTPGEAGALFSPTTTNPNRR